MWFLGSSARGNWCRSDMPSSFSAVKHDGIINTLIFLNVIFSSICFCILVGTGCVYNHNTIQNLHMHKHTAQGFYDARRIRLVRARLNCTAQGLQNFDYRVSRASRKSTVLHVIYARILKSRDACVFTPSSLPARV